MSGGVRAPRIAILAHVGNGNLGDEAIVAAVRQNLQRLCPTAELYGITARPADTRLRHGIPAYPVRPGRVHDGMARAHDEVSEPARGGARTPLVRALRRVVRRVPGAVALVRVVRGVQRLAVAAVREPRFLASCFRLLRGTDLLIVAGSAQLMDYWGGPWAFPFTLLRWTLLARLRGTKVAFVSIGAGPLETRTGKALIRRCLTWADYRSYRENSSRDLIRSLHVPGEHPVVPDLVFSLNWQRGEPPRERRRVVVGINPMPVLDGFYWPEEDRRAYERYLDTLASFADWLVQREYVVVFFPTQIRADPRTIREVRARMQRTVGGSGERGGVLLDERPIDSLEALFADIGRMDVVVATRYHGVLFPLLLGKPVLGVAYQPKTRDLMRLMGQERYTIDFGQLELATLQERFLALERGSEAFRRGVAPRLAEARQALDRQYDRLLALLGIPSTQSATLRPMLSDAVAAGDGAFKT